MELVGAQERARRDERLLAPGGPRTKLPSLSWTQLQERAVLSEGPAQGAGGAVTLDGHWGWHSGQRGRAPWVWASLWSEGSLCQVSGTSWLVQLQQCREPAEDCLAHSWLDTRDW